MIYWAPLLHFYQPPTQTHWVLDKICDESYRPLISVFRNNPTAKVTVNICAVLTELLAQHGKSDIVNGLAELAGRGQMEFTGSAKYHPILPLIPQDETMRQIMQNYETNRRFFGSVYTPKGFFSPEMCYSRDIVMPILDTGHSWAILGGISCPVEWPLNIVHYIAVPNRKLSVFFRDDILSNMISFKHVDASSFLAHLRALDGGKDIYVVTAMDAETFGHHIKSWEKIFLEEVYQAVAAQPSGVVRRGTQQLRTLVDRQKKTLALRDEVQEIRVVTITELLDLFPHGAAVEPKLSSWSTMADDIKTGNPYPLWNDPNNMVHQLLWEHLNITIDMVKEAGRVSDNDASRNFAEIARGLLDHALHSDQFWWASRRPNWDINLINRGLIEQHEALFNGYKSIATCLGLSSREKKEWHYREVAARDIRSQIRSQLLKI